MSVKQKEDSAKNGSLENSTATKEKYHFGKRFKQWRQENGISAYRIAKMTGVHPSFISNIEASRRPMSDSFMRKLASIGEFNINYETLRAWKIQSEYDVDEMKEALRYALGGSEKEVDSFLSDHPLTTSATFQIPLRGTLTAQGIQSEPDGKQLKMLNWVGAQHNNPDVYCIQVLDSSFLPVFPQNTVLLAQKTAQLNEGKKYLVQSGSEIALYEAKNSALNSLSAGKSPIGESDLEGMTLIQILAYKVDWS